MSKKILDDIFNDDEFGLLDSKPQTSFVKTDEDRLIDSFEEINVFYEKHQREPSSKKMAEYTLYARLQALRENEAQKNLLQTFDKYHLLGEVEEKPKKLEDILVSDEFGLLDADFDESLTDLKHLTPQTREKATYIAQREKMPENQFKKFEPMFRQVHQELKEGKRKLLDFNAAEKNLTEGNFYVVDGLLAYLKVADIEKLLKKNKTGDRIRLDGRTLTIFENGTYSNMLFRSLGKAIQKNGKMVTNTDAGVENGLLTNAGIIAEDDIRTGWIYVVRSKSEKAEIRNLKNLYKIGFSTTPVAQRIAHPQDEATYLFAEVETMVSYACYNMRAQKFESLIHRVFGKVCLDIDLYDNKGQRYNPREWFQVPLKIIDEVVQLIISDNIIQYYYDEKEQKLKLK